MINRRSLPRSLLLLPVHRPPRRLANRSAALWRSRELLEERRHEKWAIRVHFSDKYGLMYRRMIKAPSSSFFLFGPRGTGKSSWVRQTFPEAVYLDLLDSEVYLDLLGEGAIRVVPFEEALRRLPRTLSADSAAADS